jgi:hypothetical protein
LAVVAHEELPVKFIVPIILTVLTASFAAVLFLPWERWSNGNRSVELPGFEADLDASLLHESLDLEVPSFVPLAALGLVTIGAWLRATRLLKVPVLVMLILSTYTVFQVALTLWCVESGAMTRSHQKRQRYGDDFSVQMPLPKQ